ncbi:hypothetical protein HNE_2957 [Hyphomonas neptunium ATCC 15444]|uniref:Lipoprotein n=2 Tax=Hyphomonas TaxID=85 RepID=Q0BY08_HYPNA|nr:MULTISPECIES: hypothetical protein [Hyphomonas]ABI78108.1 hypothetical protein HNE_2957 [Hyphomonas neptunium ATCC 15444]KCZ93674.1 hypothetical protein HHI_09767 [Hyphomonas hirschiana VP5]
MKYAALTAALLGGMMTLTGCGQGKVEGKDISASSSAGDIGDAYVAELTRIADALETVDDEASARSAATEIRKAADGLKNMEEELGGEVSGMKAMQIFGNNYEDLANAQMRMMTALTTLQAEHPELMDIIGEETDRLGQ